VTTPEKHVDETRSGEPPTSIWSTVASAAAIVGGLAAAVYFVGGVVMWLRFRTAGLPRDQAVALMNREEMFVVGFRLMVLPTAAAALTAWLLMRRTPPPSPRHNGDRRRELSLKQRLRTLRDRIAGLRPAVALNSAKRGFKDRKQIVARVRARVFSLGTGLIVVILIILVMVPFTFASAMWAVGAALIVGYWRASRNTPISVWKMAAVAVLAAAVVSLGRQLDQPVQLLHASATLSGGHVIEGVFVASKDGTVYIGNMETHEIEAVSQDDITRLRLGPPEERAPNASLLSQFIGGDKFAATPLEIWCNGERYSVWRLGDLCQTQPVLTGPTRRPLDTTKRLATGGTLSFAPVRVFCPDEAHEGCRGWLRLRTVDSYDPGPYGNPVPKEFGPVRLAYRRSPDVIGPGQAGEHCVPISAGERGALREVIPAGKSSPPQPVPFVAIISKDVAGRAELSTSDYSLWIERKGLPLQVNVTECSDRAEADARRSARTSRKPTAER
jgi:hypothetical protein